MDTPLISVVVPIYNVEKYLSRCVNSIINQTYTNLEIILVDDGSTDNSGAICDEISLSDTRIKVIHKENGGLSSARNAGISKATGEYISFVDSDDYIDLMFCEKLYDILLSTNSDIAIARLLSVYSEDTQSLYSENDTVQPIIFTNISAIKTMLYQNLFDTSACGSIYKREFFEDIRYPEGKLFEDLFTTYKVLFKANRIVYLPVNLYGYFQRENSIMNTNFKLSRLDQLQAAQEILAFANEHEELIKPAKSRYMSSLFQTFRFIPDKGYTALQKEIWDKIKLNRKGIIFDSNTRLKNRIAIAISYLGKNIFIVVNKLINH